ncbi:uncharacterized protein At2g33490 isoform X1 [Syzygium oleosum]|uniref:uncharacterized protein At2g33490 isoform X1 n=1 Tax=Syzygium oleosum TaxID=219896 RepID=UPI0024B96EC5|nr:uncharacterized protein At2g33490 isoform X1 [Syzygium oleosum]
MKNSLRKLRGFGIHNHKHVGARDRRDLRCLSQLDELAQASQDLDDMRDCYDNLLSAAAATTNSAYEFSESLRELGACLLEKNALNDDEDSGEVLLMLGKVQYELQKHLDAYRSHISRTITIPSQSLLNELRTVEEMKQQCDEKRSIYEDMRKKQREKGRSRTVKGEVFTQQQLQEAHEQFDVEAAMFIFRLKSLKRGQSHSLLTQAARHHAAQLNFFKKALKSLEAVEPHVQFISEQQHIDYPFDGLEDAEGDEMDDDQDDDSYDARDDGELSFDYGQSDQAPVTEASITRSMELDQVDLTFPQAPTAEAMKENAEKIVREYFGGEIRKITQSAPLYPEKKLDPTDKMGPMRQSSTRKLQTYVLPTPMDAKSSITTSSIKPFPPSRQTSLSWRNPKLWHSSPLEPKNIGRSSADGKFSGTSVSNNHGIFKESNNNATSPLLPPPLADGLLFTNIDPLGAPGSKKFKRQAFSGPLNNKPQPNQSAPSEHPHLLYSGPILRNPISQPLSSPPKVSPMSSPPLTSSPKISELHELPRPPASSNTVSNRHSGFVGHSAPLFLRGQDLLVKKEPMAMTSASPLPIPPQVVPRSFSIPSSGLRTVISRGSKPSEVPIIIETAEDVSSPPLTPIALSNIQHPPTNARAILPSVRIGGTN